MVPAGPSTWNETKITNPKGARKPSSNQQEKAQNQSSPDKIEELATHIRYDLNRFRLKSWLKILRNNQLWREIVSKKCFKVMRRWVTHGHCLPPIGVSEVIQDLWLVITYTSLFPTWYISPVQAKCTQIWVTNFENQNHQSFFPCLPNSPPTQKKYPRERCFKQIYFGETKAFTNDKAKLEKKRKRSQGWSESSIAGWKCPPFAYFPCWKRRISIVMVRLRECNIWKFNYSTSFFQVTRMDPPNRGHVFTFERVIKKTPKMGHDQENLGAGTLACQIQSFVSAVYGYRNLATRGFQTAGCFGGNSRRSLELIQLSNKNGNQIASKTPLRNLPIPSNLSSCENHSGGYPVTFLRMTFRFFVPSNQQKPTPRTINSRPGWDADKFITAWDVASCVIRKPPIRGKLSPNFEHKGTSWNQLQTLPW